MKITSKRVNSHRKSSLMDKLRMDSDPTMVVSTQITAPRVVCGSGEMALSLRVQLIPLIGGKPYRLSLPLLALERVDRYLTDTMYLCAQHSAGHPGYRERVRVLQQRGGRTFSGRQSCLQANGRWQGIRGQPMPGEIRYPCFMDPDLQDVKSSGKVGDIGRDGVPMSGQQWKVNCRDPLVFVSKPSHLAAAEDPDSIALGSSFQIPNNGPNGVEPAGKYVSTNPIVQGPQGFVW
ncbi:hypothetical protein N7474_007346 [Penicillium riverlandense]|uniref:uncharacterized protein n=1 Tax=Penicillium riverlandense TaxID=1903569 RepID=UPI002546AD22|nr:uncharacterized protein N7474_007346 [Penicillium riverlandense]KAJ5815569.1 hypothetical protein N7474_007346 [Penicillium riverlandense]